jgi:hypothetical protein
MTCGKRGGHMTLAEKIFSHIEDLPEQDQAEVLDFVEFLKNRSTKTAAAETADRETWSNFSLAQAMRGMEGEDELYFLDDLAEAF